MADLEVMADLAYLPANSLKVQPIVILELNHLHST